MIEITIPSKEYFNEETNRFVTVKGATLKLEHSLLSISKWESIWHVPFLSDKPKSYDQTIDYIRCMTLNPSADPNVYFAIPNSEVLKINNYIENPMTASTVSEPKGGGSRNQVITSELIYFWMISHQIPFECEKWHLNRLLMLIRICNAKNSSPKQMTKNEIYNQYKSLNAARRAKSGSRG